MATERVSNSRNLMHSLRWIRPMRRSIRFNRLPGRLRPASRPNVNRRRLPSVNWRFNRPIRLLACRALTSNRRWSQRVRFSNSSLAQQTSLLPSRRRRKKLLQQAAACLVLNQLRLLSLEVEKRREAVKRRLWYSVKPRSSPRITSPLSDPLYSQLK